MILLNRPSRSTIEEFLARQKAQPFSYRGVGGTRRPSPPLGYLALHRRSLLGQGEEAFQAAGAALWRWEMFRSSWVELCWPETPLRAGMDVATLARFAGLWWLNACRLVYVIDEPGRAFGFAYGTLSGHLMAGEERFLIERQADGTVWYDLFSFSKPRHWLVRLGSPLVRRLQRRFGAESQAAMARAFQAARKMAAPGGLP